MRKLLLLLILPVLLFSGCKEEKNEDTPYDENIRFTTNSTPRPVPKPESSLVDEIVDGVLPPQFFYGGKLYESAFFTEVYDGLIKDVDNKVLDGYRFLGVMGKYRDDNISPENELESNFVPVGTPLFYNKDKNSFIIWEQKINYGVKISEYDVKAHKVE